MNSMSQSEDEVSGKSRAKDDIRISDWLGSILPILQNRLLDESGLIRFAKERGVEVFGVITGDPSKFCELGWLLPDDVSEPDRPRFHPFRLYQLVRLLDLCKLRISSSSTINRNHLPDFIKKVAKLLPSLDQISDYAQEARRVVDLAILLEPIYWPDITSRMSFSSDITQQEYSRLVSAYKSQVVEQVHRLDLEEWRSIHERLRIQAAQLDPNGDLYLLLRLSPWSRRERLKGRVSGGMWLRHIAEVLRRGFEEAHGVLWPEEDQDFGYWVPGARMRIYGSDRPLDATGRTRPYLAFQFGMRTGSVVRWYFEGETEYFAVLEIIPGAAAGGIELVNLRGAIAGQRANAPMRLADSLAQDLEQRRFSMISFDADVPANVKSIRRMVEQDLVVGSIDANKPDFEFANFSLPELVEVAARLDESFETSGEALRTHDWTGISNSRDFSEEYCKGNCSPPCRPSIAPRGLSKSARGARHVVRDERGIGSARVREGQQISLQGIHDVQALLSASADHRLHVARQLGAPLASVPA